ncbi:MAG: tetratricopeptide repeat protein [Gemmatimonadota bacterium]|nr:tetratricopeptide repeat protein [Gemmatimonadota bacterium]MDH5759640.1 tetratricopeptide repeat protein [Gemmatimonadota bacterium]
MRGVGAALFAALTLSSACTYYNSIYNAQRRYLDAEGYRIAGADSLAAAAYRDVLLRAADGYRREPSGPWAPEALSLMGRSHLRLGDLRAARAALEQVVPDTGRIASEARVYLGAVLVRSGDATTGLALLDRALGEDTGGPSRAEGHLWRARVLLDRGDLGDGWRDLDRAASHPSVAVDAGLEALRWAVEYDDSARVRGAVEQLRSEPAAAERLDSILVLMGGWEARHGPASGADVLGGEAPDWPRRAVARMRLARAVMLREAGDTATARVEVTGIARGVGESAAESRVLLSRWHLGRAGELLDIQMVRAILIPASGDPEVDSLLTALSMVDALAGMGIEEPLAWFAAGELARDRLEAPELARGLFLAYADGGGEDPWTPKALLAALDVARTPGDRAWIRGRLEGRAESPYVLAARGLPAPGLQEMEEELGRRLSGILVTVERLVLAPPPDVD